jgi:hypothetical protein
MRHSGIPFTIIDEVFNEFYGQFHYKLETKGKKPFNSILETYGKLSEEHYETLIALHKKDKKEFESELMDVAITAIFGIMSLRQQAEEKKNVR